MSVQVIVSEHEQKMGKAIDSLRNDLKAVRTSRASTAMVENLHVDYYGTPTPLKQLAALAAPQADSVVIKPFDPACIKDIEKAIKASDLSIAPVVEGKMVRLNIPPLSEERRIQLVNQAKRFGEQAKVSVRNIRRDANKGLDKEEKDKVITEDDRDGGKKQIDDATKKYTEQVDECVKAKTDEIMLN